MSAAKRRRGVKNPRRRPRSDASDAAQTGSSSSGTGRTTGRAGSGDDRGSTGSLLRAHRKLMVYLLAGALVLLMAVRATVAFEPTPASTPSGPSTGPTAASPSPAPVDLPAADTDAETVDETETQPVGARTEAGSERASTAPASEAAPASASEPAPATADPSDDAAPAPASDADPRRGIFGVDEDGTARASGGDPTAPSSGAAPGSGANGAATDAPPSEGRTEPGRDSPSDAGSEALPVGGASASGVADPAPSVVFPWLDPAALVRAATDPEARSTVRLVVRTRPAGALVLLAGRPIGSTPLETSVAATGLTPLRVEVPDEPGVRGYAPFDGVLDLSHDVELELELFPR